MKTSRLEESVYYITSRPVIIRSLSTRASIFLVPEQIGIFITSGEIRLIINTVSEIRVIIAS